MKPIVVKPLICSFVWGALMLATSSQANAKAPRGVRIPAPISMVNAGNNTGSRILFLNRCEGGCTILPGFEDSRSNHSSIIGSPRELSEFPHGDDKWNQMKRCVQRLYAPFEIMVTDVDPELEPHYEAIVAGNGGELGFPMAGGVAPFACGPIENAMSFTFALLYDDMNELCNVVGQESAHAFGLDHEMQCNDPLTYLPGCPNKQFQDVDAPCGEFTERDCDCGGETQNSYQYLYEFLGEGLVPEVFIRTPEMGATVPVGFPVEATGIDDILVTHAELWIDGTFIADADEQPFAFAAPTTLEPGPHEVEVRVFDDREQYGSLAIEVSQEFCTSRVECGFAHICVDGTCVLGPGNAAGLGAECAGNHECQNGLCATDRNAAPGTPGVCTARCEIDSNSCPEDYDCISARGGERLCIIRNEGNGGFCSASSGSDAPLGGIALGALALALGRRRRRQ